MLRKQWLCALFALMTFGAEYALSQVANATLLGSVTDSSGAVVGNAKVTITEANKGTTRTAETNSSGNYSFPDVSPGQYTVTVEMTGFKKETRRGVDLIVNTSQRVDVQLQPGNVTETVEVVGTPPAIQTDRADTGVKIEMALVRDAPLGVNRNFQSLLNIVPGTSPATFQHSQFFNASSSLQTEVNGTMRQGNNYMIDGTDNNERTGLLQILIPPIEAIQTVDASTTNHDPEFGRATGAVINVILKSGTNQLHGAAYEFLQNSAFDARSFFNKSVGHLAYNYVGGNIGGAIKKNKLFYFADYLRVMDHEANTNTVTIPSAAFRTGDLSKATTVIYDPTTGNADGTGRLPFANNLIPPSKINPVSTKLLALLPPTNQTFNEANPTNNYFGLLPFTKTTDSLDSKMDWNLNDRNRLSGRFSFSRPVVFQAPLFGLAGGGPGPGGAFMGTGTQKTYSAGLNYNHVFSPSFLAEWRVAVSHYHNEAQPSDFGSTDAATIGIPGVNISQFTSGQVGIQINDGFSNPLIGYSPSLPWIRAEANVDIVNTWTKIVGNHTIKFGADIKRIRDELLQDQTFSPRGIYLFGANQTALAASPDVPASKTGIGNDMASFLLDLPFQAGRDVNTYFPAYRQWEFFFYGGDKWVVTPKLTVDLGVRWELYPPATPQFPGGFSNYDPVNNQLVVAGVGGNPSNLGMVNHLNYFAPRVGLAYRLTEKTVIRAGFGTSYTPFPDNTYAYNYPVRANNAYNTVGNGYGPAVNASGLPVTFQAGFPAPVPVVIPSNGVIPATGSLLLNQNYFVINKNFKNPYVEAWNLAIQQALPWHFTLDVAYVGSHGVDTAAQYNLNAGMIPGLGTAGEPGAAFGRTASSTLFWAGFSSSYNSLQVKFDRRFSGGFLMTTAFTYAKGMSYQTGDDGAIVFYVNPRRNYARNDFDRTFTYVQTFIEQLPFGKGRKWLTGGPASYILGGWGVSGGLTLMSGTPFYITANGGSLNLPGTTQTANQVAPVQILHGINTGNPWFSTSSFSQPTGVTFGTMGRNSLTGPGFFNLDLSLFKTVNFTERMKLELRAEAFNFTNTPKFANPAGSPTVSMTSSTFGYVTSTIGSGSGVNGTGGGRALQLGVKLSF
jgi:hypothetical protein